MFSVLEIQELSIHLIVSKSDKKNKTSKVLDSTGEEMYDMFARYG